MLTDIFARRYESTPLRDAWNEEDRRFMVQANVMLRNLLWNTTDYEKVDPVTEATFKAVHDTVALELGHEWLSDRWWKNAVGQWNTYSMPTVIRGFLIAQPTANVSVDRFIKDRLSLVEQGFRHRWQWLKAANADFPRALDEAKRKDAYFAKRAKPATGIVGDAALAARNAATARLQEVLDQINMGQQERTLTNLNKSQNAQFEAAVEELNQRLRLAKYPLHFHNGFLQISTDEQTTKEVHEPFWSLVGAPLWASVDQQMKEAFDDRDSGKRTAPFHAVSALESAIKIINKEKGWSTGNEKGAHNFIDNLASKANGNFIAQWESEILKSMFSDVRNPFAHGAGTGNLPQLNPEQTNWTIDTAMAWSKSLITRM